MQRVRFSAYLFLLLSMHVFACVCAVPLTPSEWYKSHRGEPTFIGVAGAESTVSDIVRAGNGKPVLDPKGKPTPRKVPKITFRVEEAFEGVESQTVEVYGWGTTCDSHFTNGTRYLVYGWLGVDGKVRTSRCTRTAPLSEAAEDVRFLRSLKNRQPDPH